MRLSRQQTYLPASLVGLVGLVGLAGVTGCSGPVAAGGQAVRAGADAPVIDNRPGPRPVDEFIVYERSAAAPGARSQIWRMTGAGTERTEISRTPAGASDTSPSMGLGNGEVAFERRRAGESQIFMGNNEGDPPRQITAFPQGARTPSLWHNDIAFTSGSGAACDIWMVATDRIPQLVTLVGGLYTSRGALVNSHSRAVRRLTDHGGRSGCDSDAVWSPDGHQVAFHRTVTDAAGHPLRSSWFVVPRTGGPPRPLGLAVADVAALAWIPGSRFLVRTAGRVPTITALDARGGHPQVLVRGGRLTGSPTWGPDEVRAAFVVRRDGGSTDILSVAGTGGRPTDLTQTPGISEGHPTWGFPGNPGSEPGPGVHARSVPARRRRR